MTFPSIINRGEFFSNHYLDAVIGGDLGDVRKRWDAMDGRSQPNARSRIRSVGARYFSARVEVAEAAPGRRSDAVCRLNDVVLQALGFVPERGELTLVRSTVDELTVPVAASVTTSAGAFVVALDTGLTAEIDELFDAGDNPDALLDPNAAGVLLKPLWRSGDKKAVRSAADAVGEIFACDDPPRFVVLCGGRIVLLADRAKWAEGRFLAVDMDAALERNDTKKGGELETIAALFTVDVLVPGALDAASSGAASSDAASSGASGTDDDGEASTSGTGGSVLDDLLERSYRHAVGVSKDLRNGIRRSIEILANEVIAQQQARSEARHEQRFVNTVDPKDLTRQSLRYLYRLLVLLYAESRPELGILPTDDDAYMAGYSLDRLRELCLVDLDTDRARNGGHLHQSLTLLFDLVNDGYHADGAEASLLFGASAGAGAVAGAAVGSVSNERSVEQYLQFPGLDAALFDPAATPLLNNVVLRNEALQQVLSLLMLTSDGAKAARSGGSSSRSSGGRSSRSAGRQFISYSTLGINQLGAVYEGLMSYTGFFADTDLYEVARHGDPADGTWVLPVADSDDWPDEVFVTEPDPHTGRPVRVRHPRGTFVFRLSGRDRQTSASFYTPEVLTRCVVRHALAELLGGDDRAPAGGSAQITEAAQLLDLTICEPALGSGAFLNEAINQLSAEYLRRRQAELGVTLDADDYQGELQKVKAHFALHQSYGVDLNSTAVELAEVSLWLNAMYPGFKAPWFGLQLRHGNSLVGCRRAVWTPDQLKKAPWSKSVAGVVVPPTDVELSQPLPVGAVHHFLLPGHGWGAVADRKEAKELAPRAAEALKRWKQQVHKDPNFTAHGKRLGALSRGVEELWVQAAERIRLTQRALRRGIDVWGVESDTTAAFASSGGVPAVGISRARAEQVLSDPDSALGRLRLLMDAWVGLWFWPLDLTRDAVPGGADSGPGEGPDSGSPDSGLGSVSGLGAGVASVAVPRPPTWAEWLAVAEALVPPVAADVGEVDGEVDRGPSGQLDLFDDLDALLAAERDDNANAGRVPVAQVLAENPWLNFAVSLAQQQGAWHWPLEFAPVFQAGGFDLQVGNPPWVRLDWRDDLTLAEMDPWWGVTEKPSAGLIAERRASVLASPANRRTYLDEVAAAEGVVQSLGSTQLHPVLAGLRTNLYMLFMETVWRHAASRGMSGLLHPESHFVDPKGGPLRRAAYRHLRRHFQFLNGLLLFEDIHDMTVFGIHVSGRPDSLRFTQMSYLQHPSIVDGSLRHDGSGEAPGIQFPAGGWDLRPHAARVLTITEEVLADWALLFDEPGTPADEARLLRPVTTADLAALSVLAKNPVRLADHKYFWTQGWNETNAKKDGTIRWRTEVPESWDEVVLQGPHFTIGTPFNKQPNDPCRNNQDYSAWDLENLPERAIPRTNYQRACDRDTYDSRLDHWNGRPATSYWRVAYREMTQPGLERSLHPSIMPPGGANVGTVILATLATTALTSRWSGLLSTLPYDYFVKVSGTGHIKDYVAKRFPLPRAHPLDSALLLRTLRLNCLTADYAPLWEKLWDPTWREDGWTVDAESEPELAAALARVPLARVPLGGGHDAVGPQWSMATPLRRDLERRQALVELDAIAAIMLGLSAEQLCAMFRTQFAVLRKYEYKMAFDAEGRKLCAAHQSAGFRQSQLQAQAKAGELPKDWANLWNRYEAWEDDPALQADPNYWAGHFTGPFTRPDREAEMTRAYNTFMARLDREGAPDA